MSYFSRIKHLGFSKLFFTFKIKMDDVETQIILLLDFGVNMLLMVQTYLVFEFASISITLAPFNSVHCCSCKHLQIAR